MIKVHELLVDVTLIAFDTLKNPLEGLPVSSQFSNWNFYTLSLRWLFNCERQFDLLVIKRKFEVFTFEVCDVENRINSLVKWQY